MLLEPRTVEDAVSKEKKLCTSGPAEAMGNQGRLAVNITFFSDPRQPASFTLTSFTTARVKTLSAADDDRIGGKVQERWPSGNRTTRTRHRRGEGARPGSENGADVNFASVYAS